LQLRKRSTGPRSAVMELLLWRNCTFYLDERSCKAGWQFYNITSMAKTA
jgi:hypothetical protein